MMEMAIVARRISTADSTSILQGYLSCHGRELSPFKSCTYCHNQTLPINLTCHFFYSSLLVFQLLFPSSLIFCLLISLANVKLFYVLIKCVFQRLHALDKREQCLESSMTIVISKRIDCKFQLYYTIYTFSWHILDNVISTSLQGLHSTKFFFFDPTLEIFFFDKLEFS